MFLVDGVAKQGGGMGKKLDLPDDAQPLVQEIMTRIQRAQLAKLSDRLGRAEGQRDVPGEAARAVGRPAGHRLWPLRAAARKRTITVKGNVEGEDVSWPLTVALPPEQKDHDALAKVWARQKIEDLMHQTFYQGSPAVEETVTGIALDYKLMSQYTSFVAVDSSKAADESAAATPPRRMLVPVPLPAGTRWEGFFGGEGESDELADHRSRLRASDSRRRRLEAEELTKLSSSLDVRRAGQRATTTSVPRPGRATTTCR